MDEYIEYMRALTDHKSADIIIGKSEVLSLQCFGNDIEFSCDLILVDKHFLNRARMSRP